MTFVRPYRSSRTTLAHLALASLLALLQAIAPLLHAHPGGAVGDEVGLHVHLPALPGVVAPAEAPRAEAGAARVFEVQDPARRLAAPAAKAGVATWASPPVADLVMRFEAAPERAPVSAAVAERPRSRAPPSFLV
jgi:hypothetical protein